MADDAQEKFGRGAASMVSAVFIAKILGILFIIPMQNMTSNVVVGLYGLVYPLYNTMLTLSTQGFPLALSKTVSDLNARGQYRESIATFSIVGRTMLWFGLFGFAIMWLVGPYYLRFTAVDTTQAGAALPALYALAPALLLLPLMSAQRGYLQGNFRMEPSGASQVLEQIVRVGIVLAGLVIVVHMGASPSTETAVATFGGTAGAIAGFLLLVAAVKKTRRDVSRRTRFAPRPRLVTSKVLRSLFSYALPIAVGTLVLPLSQSIDALTVPRELAMSGVSVGAAIGLYGIYTQEALRLVQVPLSFATAIGASIMPAITDAIARRDQKLAHHRLQDAIRMMAWIALPSAVVLAILAGPIELAMFKNRAGESVFAISAAISVVSGLELVTTYILQGYDRFYQPVFHMATGLFVKLAGNLLLVPMYGVAGAAIASVVGYSVSSWLNMVSIRRVTGFSITFPRTAWRAGLACVPVAAWLYALVTVYHSVSLSLHLQQSRWLALAVIVIGVAFGGPLYLLVSLWVKAANANDMSRLPLIGRIVRRFV